VTDIGFYVSKLDQSEEVNFLVQETNNLLEKRSDVSVIFFTNKQEVPCFIPCFAVMAPTELYNFTGYAIATNIDTASKLLQLPGPKKKFFMINNFEWVGKVYSHEYLRSIYANPQIILIVRNFQEHATILECWGTNAGVIPDFNLETFVDYLNAEN
jgi:hypothetical protein